MDMDFAKVMQMMNAMNGGNKNTAMLMQLLPQIMSSDSSAKKAPPQIHLNNDEVNKTIYKLYNDEK